MFVRVPKEGTGDGMGRTSFSGHSAQDAGVALHWRQKWWLLCLRAAVAPEPTIPVMGLVEIGLCASAICFVQRLRFSTVSPLYDYRVFGRDVDVEAKNAALDRFNPARDIVQQGGGLIWKIRHVPVLRLWRL
jgi:hypothetical protein